MSTDLAVNLADQPAAPPHAGPLPKGEGVQTVSRKLPPSERDFEIYEAVQVGNSSTYMQALKWEISQTRVRQIVRRVVEWLGEVLPPQTKIAREQEIHLARQIAADRFQHQLAEAETFWKETQDIKYAGLRIRLTTAQARLGVVSRLLGGLAADAIEGIPVPGYSPPADPAREGGPSAEPNPKSETPNLFPPAGFNPRTPTGRRRKVVLPREIDGALTPDELTPEIAAARAAWGWPVHPEFIEYCKKYGSAWKRATAEANVGPAGPDGPEPQVDNPSAAPVAQGLSDQPCPPVEDFSAPQTDSTVGTAPSHVVNDESADPCMACDTTTVRPTGASTDDNEPPKPLLTESGQLPVTEVQITPEEPGALISQASAAPADSGRRGVYDHSESAALHGELLETTKDTKYTKVHE